MDYPTRNRSRLRQGLLESLHFAFASLRAVPTLIGNGAIVMHGTRYVPACSRVSARRQRMSPRSLVAGSPTSGQKP